MTRIEKCEAEIARVEGEIRALEGVIAERAGELADLQAGIGRDPANVDLTIRANAVRQVLERLRAELPRGGQVGPGDIVPKLQRDLIRAQQALEDAKRERQAARRRLAEVERLAARYGADVGQIHAGLDGLIKTMQRLGWPGRPDEAGLLAWRAWAAATAAEINALPGLRRQLAEVGDDPAGDAEADGAERSRRARADSAMWGGLGPEVPDRAR